MKDLQDIVAVAKLFKELTETVAESVYEQCRPLIEQRDRTTQQSASSWLQRTKTYEAIGHALNFLDKAGIKDKETRYVLIDAVASHYVKRRFD